MKFRMLLRRIFAGSILTLLLSASSLGAACDVSCAFASMNSDCHSQRAGDEASASGGMNMPGMAMPGMDLPEMGGGQDQQAIPAISETRVPHPAIGEMGPCETQTCDSGSVGPAKSNGSGTLGFHSIAAAIGIPRIASALPHFQDSQGDTASFLPRNRSSLQLNLRV